MVSRPSPAPLRAPTTDVDGRRRTLKTKQKINYLDAVKCLMHTPGLNPGAVTRYEDFLIEHQIMTPIVHFTGVFLPWHRLLLHQIERALRDECGYRDAVP